MLFCPSARAFPHPASDFRNAQHRFRRSAGPHELRGSHGPRHGWIPADREIDGPGSRATRRRRRHRLSGGRVGRAWDGGIDRATRSRRVRDPGRLDPRRGMSTDRRDRGPKARPYRHLGQQRGRMGRRTGRIDGRWDVAARHGLESHRDVPRFQVRGATHAPARVGSHRQSWRGGRLSCSVSGEAEFVTGDVLGVTGRWLLGATAFFIGRHAATDSHLRVRASVVLSATRSVREG